MTSNSTNDTFCSWCDYSIDDGTAQTIDELGVITTSRGPPPPVATQGPLASSDSSSSLLLSLLVFPCLLFIAIVLVKRWKRKRASSTALDTATTISAVHNSIKDTTAILSRAAPIATDAETPTSTHRSWQFYIPPTIPITSGPINGGEWLQDVESTTSSMELLAPVFTPTTSFTCGVSTRMGMQPPVMVDNNAFGMNVCDDYGKHTPAIDPCTPVESPSEPCSQIIPISFPSSTPSSGFDDSMHMPGMVLTGVPTIVEGSGIGVSVQASVSVEQRDAAECTDDERPASASTPTQRPSHLPEIRTSSFTSLHSGSSGVPPFLDLVDTSPEWAMLTGDINCMTMQRTAALHGVDTGYYDLVHVDKTRDDIQCDLVYNNARVTFPTVNAPGSPDYFRVHIGALLEVDLMPSLRELQLLTVPLCCTVVCHHAPVDYHFILDQMLMADIKKLLEDDNRVFQLAVVLLYLAPGSEVWQVSEVRNEELISDIGHQPCHSLSSASFGSYVVGCVPRHLLDKNIPHGIPINARQTPTGTGESPGQGGASNIGPGGGSQNSIGSSRQQASDWRQDNGGDSGGSRDGPPGTPGYHGSNAIPMDFKLLLFANCSPLKMHHHPNPEWVMHAYTCLERDKAGREKCVQREKEENNYDLLKEFSSFHGVLPTDKLSSLFKVSQHVQSQYEFLHQGPFPHDLRKIKTDCSSVRIPIQLDIKGTPNSHHDDLKFSVTYTKGSRSDCSEPLMVLIAPSVTVQYDWPEDRRSGPPERIPISYAPASCEGAGQPIQETHRELQCDVVGTDQHACVPSQSHSQVAHQATPARVQQEQSHRCQPESESSSSSSSSLVLGRSISSSSSASRVHFKSRYSDRRLGHVALHVSCSSSGSSSTYRPGSTPDYVFAQSSDTSRRSSQHSRPISDASLQARACSSLLEVQMPTEEEHA